MVTIFIFVVVFVVIFVKLSDDDYIAAVIGGAIAGGLVGFTLALGLGAAAPKSLMETKYQIQAVVDATAVEGSVYVLSGHVKEDFVYRFYIPDTDGDLTFKQVSAKMTTIRIRDDQTPSLIEIRKKASDSRLNLFMVDPEDGSVSGYVLIVPPNSIVSGAELDLK